MADSLDIRGTSLVLVAGWLAVLVLPHFLDRSLVSTLGHVGVLAACLGIVAGVALLIRWRVDGRAQSWWLAVGYLMVCVPGLLDARSGILLSLCGLTVALPYFVAAWRTTEVDSILSVRRAAGAFAIGLATTVGAQALLSRWPTSITGLAASLGVLYAVLAFRWCRSRQDKPWFVIPLLGFALCCAIFAFVPDAVVGAAGAGCMQLMINGVAAATALGGLQGTAVRHRALALDAERERDLINSLRQELEARYAETLHEVRSTILALEGGFQVLQPLGTTAGTRNDALTHSFVAELQRLRALADPDNAVVPGDFRLAEGLQHLVALSRASGWPVKWGVDDTITVRGRPGDVAQIMHGLLSNASKYAPDAPVEVSTRIAGKFVLVLVDDYGPGVRPANRERIFERGERPDHDPGEEGHGLGLHIARRLARSLGGELWVEQHPRGGARFALALRRAPGDRQTVPIMLEGTAS